RSTSRRTSAPRSSARSPRSRKAGWRWSTPSRSTGEGGVARMEPTGRRKAPPDDRLREIRVLACGKTTPHSASLHAGYKKERPTGERRQGENLVRRKCGDRQIAIFKSLAARNATFLLALI